MSDSIVGDSALALTLRAIVRATAYFGRPLRPEEVKLIVGAVLRYLDEPDAPTTRLQ